jgi:Na+/H+-dicarboxylate symporter
MVLANFFESMVTNEILQILVFSLFFGFALCALKNRPVTIVHFIEELAHAMLKLTECVMLVAPMGVFGAVAAAITTQGIGVLAM